MSVDFFYEKIADAIFAACGGKENLSKESQQIIQEAFILAIDDFTDQKLIYPRDPDINSWIILGKTMTYIKTLSLKKDIPIVGYREIPVMLESAREMDSRSMKVALIQIGLSEAVYSKHDARLGALFELKDQVKISKVILKTIQKNISDDVVFVCLPELAVPSDESFLGELERLAKERNMFIIAGSFHDFELRSNISLVITPGRERFAQHKIRGSDEYGEGLKPQVYCVVKIFNAGVLRFAVLICSDAMLDSVASLLSFRSMRCQGVDIVFNPSHTRAVGKIHNGIRRLCNKVFSYVAFVNSQHGGSVVFIPKKMSSKHPMMSGRPCDPCQDYEVKVIEFPINVEELQKFRKAYFGIKKPEECYVSPF